MNPFRPAARAIQDRERATFPKRIHQNGRSWALRAREDIRRGRTDIVEGIQRWG